ncbi:YcnI family protein [Alicyclobacillus sp.]|uniref:YcnI family copper-binding membrane protein n=1 Tax=Alicyclobacillus sp. TaxID=61169 RepID=UPI0025C3726D|nr:YcnI family protein [Alicyclobacillus sp.]MCL6517676.1 YcnI family protein [Alicyclobacillus sp.]
MIGNKLAGRIGAGVLTGALWLGMPAAWAHVTVSPPSSTVGAWEKYTMRVPTEKDVPTVKVVLKIPAGVTFEQYEPVPGWTVKETKDASGRVTQVTWSAGAGGILPGQFQEFSFIGKNPGQSGDVAWDAYQYYQDGSIVEWTGQPGTDTPHAVTQILASAPAGQGQPAAGATSGRADSSNAAAQPSTQTGASAGKASVGWPGVVSGIALVLSLVALGLAWFRRPSGP